MPLTAKGRKIKRQMKKEYGKRKGASVFYAFERKHPRSGIKKGK